MNNTRGGSILVFLQNHHTVAKRVETVFLFYGLQICFVNKVFPGEGGRHTQGRRIREVKIRNQAVNGFKLITRINKQICPFFARVSNMVFVRKTFQSARTGGAAGKYTFARLAHRI